MTPTDASKTAGQSDPSALAAEVWLMMSDVVLDQHRSREVADAVGVSFGRMRAVRRLARHPMSMSELALALNIDKPNATTVVDDLEKLGLVRRTPHPTDRRAKRVETTAEGDKLAARADEILGRPPQALTELGRDTLTELREALGKVLAAAPPDRGWSPARRGRERG
ncbi:MAG TPA: MarR family transcriptional regulator [Solirubrobacteraceae bacterium]|jgi:DNA-binding MarR family transcriptional regulator|nr:MarR family transcriptional regulator [Solirubrobacteraceae bacterium]